MLQIIIEPDELFDEKTGEFVQVKGQTLQLEHSLVSLSKWESKWCKPFLSTEDKSYEETIDYIKCMTLTQNVKPETYLRLTNSDIQRINEYISAPMTATTFSSIQGGKKNKEVTTAELIYYMMIAFNIPMECQKWHLNRLLTLIRVCDIKNSPNNKMSKRDTVKSYAELNAQRRKALNSKG